MKLFFSLMLVVGVLGCQNPTLDSQNFTTPHSHKLKLIQIFYFTA